MRSKAVPKKRHDVPLSRSAVMARFQKHWRNARQATLSKGKIVVPSKYHGKSHVPRWQQYWDAVGDWLDSATMRRGVIRRGPQPVLPQEHPNAAQKRRLLGLPPLVDRRWRTPIAGRVSESGKGVKYARMGRLGKRPSRASALSKWAAVVRARDAAVLSDDEFNAHAQAFEAAQRGDEDALMLSIADAIDHQQLAAEKRKRKAFGAVGGFGSAAKKPAGSGLYTGE